MIRVERDKVTFYQFLGLQEFSGIKSFRVREEKGVLVSVGKPR